MRTGSKDKRLVELKRKQIAQNAASVMVKNSYHQTGVRQIASSCNMSIGALYNYVGSKEDVLYLVMQDSMSAFAEFHTLFATKFEKMKPSEALGEAVRCYCRLIDRWNDRLLFAYLETKTLPAKYRDASLDAEFAVISKFEKLVVKGCESGEFDVANPRLTALNITTICEMWGVRRWFMDKNMTLDDYVSAQTRHILRSINNSRQLAVNK